jgi:hypothetical protein
MRGGIAVAVLLACTAARADPSPAPLLLSQPVPAYQPPVAWSVAAGVATGLVSLAVGGALMATNDHREMAAGTYVMMTGLALSPAVSHLVSREWGRAAIFGALPTAALIGMVALMEVHPPVLYEGNKDPTRIVYATLVAAAVVTAAGGIVDSMWAGERARKKRVTVAPVVTRGQYGLALGGSW